MILVVLLCCWQTGSSTGESFIYAYMQAINYLIAQYFVSVERPCPSETVTFTCTVNGTSMRWEPSDVDRITVRTTLYNLNEPLMPRTGYTVSLIAFTDTTITSTLSRTAENGITVTCTVPFPTLTIVGSSTINVDLVGMFSLCYCMCH